MAWIAKALRITRGRHCEEAQPTRQSSRIQTLHGMRDG
jgi:hypothetical protein